MRGHLVGTRKTAVEVDVSELQPRVVFENFGPIRPISTATPCLRSRANAQYPGTRGYLGSHAETLQVTVLQPLCFGPYMQGRTRS
eukprot:383892-Rhodomonas_salina.6